MTTTTTTTVIQPSFLPSSTTPSLSLSHSVRHVHDDAQKERLVAMQLLNRVNVHVNRHGRAQPRPGTIKMSLKGGLVRLLGPSRSALCPDRRKFNRKLNVLCRKYSMFGKLRSILTNFCSKVLGLLLVSRPYRYQHRHIRRQRPRRGAAPLAPEVPEVPPDNAVEFPVNFQERNQLQALFRTLMSEVTRGIIQTTRGVDRPPNMVAALQDRVHCFASENRRDVDQRAVQAFGEAGRDAQPLADSMKAMIDAMIRDPRQRIPGSLFADFSNQLALEMAVEMENMVQRGLLQSCYMVPYFTAENGGDARLAVQMAQAFRSKRRMPQNPGEVAGCVWTEEDIACVAAAQAQWLDLLRLAGRNPLRGGGNGGEEDEEDDEWDRPVQEDEMGNGEEGNGDGLVRITRTSIKRNTAACLDMMVTWLREIEAYKDDIQLIQRLQQNQRRQRIQQNQQNQGIQHLQRLQRRQRIQQNQQDLQDLQDLTPIKVFNLCPQARIEVKSAPMTGTMWRLLLCWVFGEVRVRQTERGQAAHGTARVAP